MGIFDKLFGLKRLSFRTKPLTFKQMLNEVCDLENRINNILRGYRTVRTPDIDVMSYDKNMKEVHESISHSQQKVLDDLFLQIKNVKSAENQVVNAQLKSIERIIKTLDKVSFHCSTAIAKERCIKAKNWFLAGFTSIKGSNRNRAFHTAIDTSNRFISSSGTGLKPAREAVREAKAAVVETQKELKKNTSKTPDKTKKAPAPGGRRPRQ